jgi:hypothetical protein
MALRKILAFFNRDIAIAKTYRGAFVLELFRSPCSESRRSIIFRASSRAPSSGAHCRKAAATSLSPWLALRFLIT